VVKRTRTVLLAATLLAALALPGCGYRLGGGDGYGDPQAAAPPVATPTATPSVSAKPEKAAEEKSDAAGILTNKLIATTIPKMGKVVTDAKGWVLYRFDLDSAKPSESTCNGKCAKIWPAVLTDGQPELVQPPADDTGDDTGSGDGY
jgi:hypothetical protein